MASPNYYNIGSDDYISYDFAQDLAKKCNLDGPISYEYEHRTGTKFTLKGYRSVTPEESVEEAFKSIKPKEVNMDFVSFSVY